MTLRLACTICLVCLASACGTSRAALDATTTQVAGEIYGTQTAQVPPPTHTLLSQYPTRAGYTQAPSTTPLSTSTPIPLAPTLTADQMELRDELLLCYKAAVSVKVDWEIHGQVTATWLDGKYQSTDQKVQNLNAFLWERSRRFGGIRILDQNDLPQGNDTLIVDGVAFKLNFIGTDDCDPYLGSIIAASDGLRFGPWGVGASSRLSASRSLIRSTVSDLRKELHNEYGVYYVILDSIEDPYWIYAHDRYGVDLPNWLD